MPALDPELLDALLAASPEELGHVVQDMPRDAVAALLEELGVEPASMPETPLLQAMELDEGYRERPHLAYASQRIAQAVRDVEAGRSRRLIIEMPPRMGKTYLATQISSLWLLRRHANWNIALTSHDGNLAAQWGRQVRRWVEQGKAAGVEVARDAGAVKEWETVSGGGVLSRSIRESFTGRGAKVLVIDDPHKDFADAHSATGRESVWNWWLSVAQTRLEPPSLVIVIATRWHEDDLIGRLLSNEHEGDPEEWERIQFPALATSNDQLERAAGAPLLSPLFEETSEEAAARWAETRTSVGEYVWSALMQQQPAPAKGAIFDADSWRYWTDDAALAAKGEKNVVYLNPATDLTGARWLDSWDMAFKGTSTSDYVVGQRWARQGPNRYLLDQVRGRMTFTETLARVKSWLDSGIEPQRVHQRLVEDKANGTAILDTLSEQVSGFKPVNPRDGKEARARAVTPEIESGHVYLPHPSMQGYGWVRDLLSELRNFPHDAHDDQCLVGETVIETPGGPRRLDSIRPGDAVRSATGWALVLEAGRTGIDVPVVSRVGLVGTANHPVWTEERGWVPLDELAYNDTIWMLAQSKDATGPGKRADGACPTTSGGVGTATRPLGAALESSAGASRTAVKSASPEDPLLGSAARTGSPAPALASRSSSATASSSAVTPTRASRLTGATSSRAARMRRVESALSTARSICERWGRFHRAGRFTTSTATPATMTRATSKLYLATSTSRATRAIEALGARIAAGVRQCSPTSSASEPTPPCGTAPRRVAAGTVSTPVGASRTSADVWNITTTDGTYYANGVLVHNCDALTQALSELRESGRGSVGSAARRGARIERGYARGRTR